MANGFDVRGRALQAGGLAAWLAEHSLGNRFGMAIAGTGLAIVAADGDGRYIDITALTPHDEAALASWLADPGPPKAVHDAKLVMHALAGRGWTLRGVTSDTALTAHLLPERRSLSFNELLVRHMRCGLPAEGVEQLLILTACAVLDLADVLDEELARIDSSSLLGRVELPIHRVLAEMESVGIAVDRDCWSESAINSTKKYAPLPPSTVCWIRSIPMGASTPPSTRPGPLPAGSRRRTRTYMTSRSTSMLAGICATPSWRGMSGVGEVAAVNQFYAWQVRARMAFNQPDSG